MVKQLYKILPWGNLHIIKCSGLIHQSPPNWQGFMAKIVKGVWDCTSIRFHPIIPLNPSSDEAVYSTMVFVLHQAGKLSMYCAALTFDQPLYLRAYRINEENRRVPKLDLAGWWFPSVDVIPWNRMQAHGRKRT